MSTGSYRIDYHSHILPEMDDGPKDRETAVEMLHLLREQGILTVYATPHYYRHQETVEDFLERRGRAAGMLEKVTPWFMQIPVRFFWNFLGEGSKIGCWKRQRPFAGAIS